MREARCPLCGDGLHGPAYLVEGAHRYPGRRRWTGLRFLICPGCFEFGFDIARNVYRAAGSRELNGWRWWDIVGRGDLMPPAPCVACDRPVIRNSDPLLKRVTCSAACATSLTRTRNGNQGSGRPCEVCGTPITTGRADSVTCSPACRQKAYRQRKANAQP